MKRQSPGAPPPDFLTKMRGLLSANDFNAFLAAYDQPRQVALRVNTLKITSADFSSIAPFQLAPVGEWEQAGFYVLGDSRPGRHPYHDAGLYYLQEPSAMVAGALLAPVAGETVLDLSAAPGGKATHLASLMDAQAPAEPRSALRRALDASGLLVANDPHAGRARLLAENLARWGAVNVLVTQDTPVRLAGALGPIFDKVLIDAPCSGEGMFRRLDEIEWSEEIVAACARRQREIIGRAPDLVRPGGRLLYSTCTFSPEEDEAIVGAFLDSAPDFRLQDPPRFPGFDRGRADWAPGARDAEQLARAVRLWPHRFPGEGHFLALMRREGSAAPGLPDVFPRRAPTRDEERAWRAFVDAVLSVEIPAGRLHVHHSRLLLLPRTAPATGHAHIIRYGLLLGEFRPGRFQPAHELALALVASDARAAVSWTPDDPRLRAYLTGADLPAYGQGEHNGWTLVTVDGYGLGWGKRSGGTLKNHYPRHLRRPATATL